MNRTIKIIIGIILLVIVVWGGVKLFGTKNEKAIEPIKIGVILPLTGNVAKYGEEMKRGVELAIEKNKGIPIEVFYEDSKFDTKEGVSVYQKLKNANGIKIMITAGSPVALAISPLANSDHIFQMAIAASTPKYTSENDFTFRVTTRSEVEDQELAKFVVPRYKNIGLLYVNNEWGVSHYNAIKTEIEKLKGNIVAEETFLMDGTDFRTQLLKIKSKNPEAVFLLAVAKNAGIILKQAKELEIKTQFFGTQSLQSQDLISIAGEEANGIIYSYSFDPQAEGLITKTFVEKYKAKYNEEPTSYVAEGYDALDLIIKAINECKEINTDCMKTKLSGVKDYPGILGSLTFDKNGDVYYPYFIKTVKNGQFVKYEE